VATEQRDQLTEPAATGHGPVAAQVPLDVWQTPEREFITNAAHELQSPLAAILSAVEVLQAGAKDKPERDRFIEHIERETRRLDRITKALLTLARAQTGAEAPRSELIDLKPMLEAIVERCEPLPGVEIAVECASDLALVSNPELLEQAITNVARNSVKYTEQGTIKLVAEPLDGRVLIAVVDTGVGIPDDALPRVAERFYRAEASGHGFGLGLAIVQAAIEVLDGELDIVSRVGHGTTVTMSLPTRALRMTH
jgi:two-component system, OmpR family, phosphate regulon sensor histidine kinase PhoR